MSQINSESSAAAFGAVRPAQTESQSHEPRHRVIETTGDQWNRVTETSGTKCRPRDLYQATCVSRDGVEFRLWSGSIPKDRILPWRDSCSAGLADGAEVTRLH